MWLNFLFDRPKMIELNSTNYTIWKLLMKLLYDIYFGWEDFWVAYLCVRWKNIWLPTSRIRKFGLISRVKYDRINLHKLYNLKGPHEACHMVVIFGVRRLSGCLFMCKIFGLYFFFSLFEMFWTLVVRNFRLSRVKYDWIKLHKLYNLKAPHQTCYVKKKWCNIFFHHLKSLEYNITVKL